MGEVVVAVLVEVVVEVVLVVEVVVAGSKVHLFSMLESTYHLMV
jgi:hypothetical protein